MKWSKGVKPNFVTPKVAILRTKRLIFIGLWCLSALFQRVQADSVPVLRQNTTIKTGNTEILLLKGTTLSVLKKSDLVCIISVNLPDGTPIITQLPSSVISIPRPIDDHNNVMSGLAKAGAEVSLPPQSRSQPDLNAEKAPQFDESAVNPPEYPLFKLPSDSLDSVLPANRYIIQTGTFQLPINNAVASVVYAVPVENGKIAQSASNLIFYGPYPNEKTKLTGNILPNLVRNLGCAIFSFQIDGLGQAVSDKPYYFREAGWFEVALEARDLLIAKFALERRKLILVGYSGGAGMVMNFAGAYPDQVEAVAAQAPNVVPPFPHGNKIKWLMVVNRGDTNRAVMKPFYEQLRSENCQALYCETTPERNRGHYHSPSGQTFDLIYSYIAGILDQRRLADEGTNDVAHLWPYVAPSSPLQRYAIAKTSDLATEDLQYGRFDFLPSLPFTMKWSQVCPPEQTVKVGDGHTRLTLNFPARQVPAGVILYYDNPSFADVPREIEDINSLAERGYLVVSTMTANPEDFVTAAAGWVKSQDKLEGVHIHLVGNGVAGARFIAKVAERNDISFKSLSILDFGETWLQVDCSEGVTSAAKECGMFGFYSYSDSEEKSDLEMWADGLVDRGAQDRGCFNVCSKPDATPPMQEALRHTQAEDQALALVNSLIARADAR
jgi:pimeloyl-ACP methyl ester carboxylesterase